MIYIPCDYTKVMHFSGGCYQIVSTVVSTTSADVSPLKGNGCGHRKNPLTVEIEDGVKPCCQSISKQSILGLLLTNTTPYFPYRKNGQEKVSVLLVLKP